MQTKLILSIESSCDETSLSLILFSPKTESQSFVEYINSQNVLYQIVSSQIKIHREYGGVIPELGARHHANSIHILFEKLLYEASNRIISVLSKESIDMISKVGMTDQLNQSLEVVSFQPEINLDQGQLKEFLKQNKLDLNDLIADSKGILKSLDSIMVTTNPGLTSSLKVGIEFAKTVKYFVESKYNISVEIEDINHLNGHVASSFFVV